MKSNTRSADKSAEHQMKCPAFLFIVFLAAFALTFSIFSAIVSSENADSPLDAPPPIRGVEISKYDMRIQQNAGTIKTYDVIVKNIGVLEPTEMTMREDRLLDTWFTAKNTISGLMFGEEDTLQYQLSIPRTTEGGTHLFSIVAYASYGTSTKTDIQPVFLEIIPYEGVAGNDSEEGMFRVIPTTEKGDVMIGGKTEGDEPIVITPEELQDIIGDVVCIGDVCGEVVETEEEVIVDDGAEETKEKSLVREIAKSAYSKVTGFLADTKSKISSRVPAAGTAGDLVENTAKTVAKPFEFVFSIIQRIVSFARRTANNALFNSNILMNIVIALIIIMIVLATGLKYLLKE